jgi:TonB family protein
MIAVTMIILVTCCLVACQDQVLEEFSESTISQSQYPPEIKAHMDAYLKKHPDAKLTYMDGMPEEVDKFMSSPQVKDRIIYTYNINQDGVIKKGVLLTNITQYADALQSEEKVYMVVEHQPEFPGGFDALKNFIRENMLYPEASRKAGKSGTVYVSMVINENGAVTDTKVLRGIDPAIDAEALRVVSSFPAWTAGTQNGKAVKVRYTLPIRFGNSETAEHPANPAASGNEKMIIMYSSEFRDGVTILSGTVLRKNGNTLLPGVKVTIDGGNVSTATDASGNFRIVSPSRKGRLNLSFVGFESAKIDF